CSIPLPTSDLMRTSGNSRAPSIVRVRFTALVRSPIVSISVPSRSKAAARIRSTSFGMCNSTPCRGKQRHQPLQSQESRADTRLIRSAQRLLGITQRSEQQVGRSEILNPSPDSRRGEREQTGRLGGSHTDRGIFQRDGAVRLDLQLLQSKIVYVGRGLLVPHHIASGDRVEPVQRLRPQRGCEQRSDVL